MDSRVAFGKYLKESCTINMPDQNTGAPPLIDYEVNIDDGEWALWKRRVPNVEIETNKVSTSDVLISTVDTIRHEDLLRGYFLEKRPRQPAYPN